MHPIKETEKKLGKTSIIDTTIPTYESIDQFAKWLENDLDRLVAKFAEFETDKSVRKFFKRS